MSQNPVIDVACALIVKEGRVLVTQRSAHMRHPLQWEFPGGKLEVGELPEVCLAREIMEELHIEIHVLQALPATVHDYGSTCVRLLPYIAEHISGEIILEEHEDCLWVANDEIMELDWVPADIPVVQSWLRHLEDTTP
ncbi:MAG TPA: (deoxy)nucleoside triphosphate pyrophosphohydrolase [Cytophagales bacterium]|nr:(deoxy)nucleoside triphosphate pyrophosphohydrolase [Cytophagales bacterium]